VWGLGWGSFGEGEGSGVEVMLLGFLGEMIMDDYLRRERKQPKC
jgi:hypothetical protein